MRYGQRHAVEIEAARRVARAMRVARHVELEIDLRAFGGSALTADRPVPKDRTDEAMSQGIPVTYVPARNTVFLALALASAERSGHLTSGLASIASIIRDIPIAVRSSSARSRRWPIWRPAWASRERDGSRFMPRCYTQQGDDHRAGTLAGSRLRANAQLLRSDAERFIVRPVRCMQDPPVGIRPARNRRPHRLLAVGLNAGGVTSRSTRKPGQRAGFPFREC